MALPKFTLAQLQALYFAQYSAVANTPANTNEGSSVWSIGNAAALLALNTQQQAQYIDAIARLATSTGADVDSFVTSFGITRLAASFATGPVVFTAPSVAQQQIVVPVGGQVSTPGGLVFTVIADTTNGAYNAGLNGYPINIGNQSVTATVQCQVSGTVGNVQANQISQLFNSSSAPPITGISTVNNTVAFTNAQNAETDAQLIVRFAKAMSTGVVGTDNAIAAAVLAVQPGLTYSIGDGLNQSGGAATATVSVFVNVANQSGAPAATLIAAVQAALQTAKAGGIVANAYAPTIQQVPVTATIHLPSSLTAAQVTSASAACSAALTSYLNGIGLNPTGGTTEVDYISVGSLLLTTLQANGGTKVDLLTVNGGTSDVVANFGTQLVAGTITLTTAQP